MNILALKNTALAVLNYFYRKKIQLPQPIIKASPNCVKMPIAQPCKLVSLSIVLYGNNTRTKIKPIKPNINPKMKPIKVLESSYTFVKYPNFFK